MAKFLLVHFSKNWADEFDVCGTRLYTEEEWKAEMLFLKDNPTMPVRCWFGTNEGWGDDGETLNDFENAYKIVEISEATYNELKKIMAGAGPEAEDFGTFFSPTDLTPDDDEEN